MGVSLTIHSSTLQFLLTNLKEEKYPGIEALNLFIRGSLRNITEEAGTETFFLMKLFLDLLATKY